MPDHEPTPDQTQSHPPKNLSSSAEAETTTPPRRQQWFTTPEPIKRLFNHFPLKTLLANDLPIHAANYRDYHTLHLFTTPEDAHHGLPSFNPTCLKWQAYMKFQGLDLRTIPSNNHASPTGALPFILPPSTHNDVIPTLPISPPRFQKWVREKRRGHDEPVNMRYEAYMAMIEHRIRDAWLYTLYLEPRNLKSVAAPLYINTASSSLLVRLTLTRQLRLAAQSELLKRGPVIDPQALFTGAEAAFAALSTLLGDDENFFGADMPGLFDASVFAYTNLLLEEEMEWEEGTMRRMVMKHGNLVKHRRRIYREYFWGA